MKLIMDLSQSGLEMFFKDYQLEALRTLWESDKGLLSREVWEKVNQRLETSISRASIINFLNDMLKMEILTGVDETGKGGHRTRYFKKMTEQQLGIWLSRFVNEKLNEIMDS